MPAEPIEEEFSRILAAPSEGRAATAARLARSLRLSGGYRWAGIYDVDIARGKVTNLAWDGPGPPAFPEFPITQGLTSRAVATGRTVNVGDVAADSDYLTALPTTRSEIILPILAEDTTAGGCTVIGTLDVESELPNAFDAVAQARLERYAALLRPFWTTPPIR